MLWLRQTGLHPPELTRAGSPIQPYLRLSAMSKPKKETVPPASRFHAMAALRGYKTPYWPDDCPTCGTRMEFVYVPLSRACVCGYSIRATELFKLRD